MLLLNFSHPLTPPQHAHLETLLSQPITDTRAFMPQFDHAQPFAEQIRTLVNEIGLTPEQWQTAPLLLVPPAYNFAALALIAELHGRMGYFPAIVRLRPIPESTPTQYEVAEVINLQTVREQARITRNL